MPLQAGERLGAFEILTLIGIGGMGEVYRARDTKLNRDVAIKTLPAGVATDPERLARFQLEAQVLASLNHPNIAHIYGVEDSTRRPRARDGARRRTDAGRADRARSYPARRHAFHRCADRPRHRGRPRAGRHPSRSQASEHQGPIRRHREGAPLRSRESARTGLPTARRPGSRSCRLSQAQPSRKREWCWARPLTCLPSRRAARGRQAD